MDDLRTLLRPTRDCHCSLLRRASRALTAHYERSFRGCDLRATQFTVLSALIQMGSISILPLAEQLGVERTTLTRLLRPLEERKLIRTSARTSVSARTPP